MDILSLISSDTGIVYKKKSNTHGSEYSGPCFICGGDDRFSIHPMNNHFVCRMCKRAGDSIEFVKEFHGKNYFEACSYLGINPEISFRQLDTSNEDPGQNEIEWVPREISIPSEKWQNRAESFLFEKFKFLMSSSGLNQRKWLNDRGINNETIKKARIGYNSSNLNFDMESWGLAPETNKNGKNKKIWIPKGIIIPQFHCRKLVRLRVRQENPVSNNRFIVVIGSSMGYFDYDAHLSETHFMTHDNNKPSLITESELDGWLLWQESCGKLSVFAAGSSTARPDIDTHKTISNKPGLLNLDNDKSGNDEAKWWANKYDNIVAFFSEKMKDPGEDFEAGIDISSWIKKGLKNIDQVGIFHEKNIDQVTKCPSKNIDQVGIFHENNLTQKTTHKGISNGFKSEILEKYNNTKQKQTLIKKTKQLKKKTKTVKNKPRMPDNKICYHNLYCASVKAGLCLVCKNSIYSLNRCPIDKWWIFKTGNIEEVILGPGVKKMA